MYYIVQFNDTLADISRKYNLTFQAILNANVICSPVLAGELLVLPDYDITDLDIPKAGAGPYYIVKPGDTLYCLSQQIRVPIQTLMKINDIQDPNMIYAGSELLLYSDFESPEELKLLWESIPDEDCMIYGLSSYGNYYLRTFNWAAFGEAAIGPLLDLLKNPCEEVRYYAIMSLGRLGLNGGVIEALVPFIENNDDLSGIAQFAIKRINFKTQGLDRIHIVVQDSYLWTSPTDSVNTVKVPAGSEIIVLKWFIPDPAKEGFRGGYLIFDYVLIERTGQTGLLPRIGLGAITFL